MDTPERSNTAPRETQSSILIPWPLKFPFCISSLRFSSETVRFWPYLSNLAEPPAPYASLTASFIFMATSSSEGSRFVA